MKLKENAQPGSTSDFFYDIFDGGYIDPEDFLIDTDAAKVRAALRTVLEFRDFLEENGMMEYY